MSKKYQKSMPYLSKFESQYRLGFPWLYFKEGLKKVPIHSFLIDNDPIVPFRLIQLTKEGSYDTSVPHRHNYYELFVFENGGGVHNIDFESHPIQANSIHFVSPGQVHCVDRTEFATGYVILFSREFYSKNHTGLLKFPFLNNNGPTNILTLSSNDFQVIDQLILQIKQEQEVGDDVSNDLMLAHLNTLLVYCSRHFKAKHNTSNLGNDSISNRFRQLIEENYLKTHHVSAYSSMLRLSDKQLATATNKELGLTPKELIQERVLLEAKRLVSFSHYSIQEIAYYLKYEDASYFSRFFKRGTGMTPKAFREKSTR